MSGLLLSDDLMFTSRITGTAQALGLQVKPAPSMAKLLELARQQQPTGVIVDLANPGLNIEELLTGLNAAGTKPRVIAYGSHVDVETLKRARDAGCDEVFPRSKFVEVLPDQLPAWIS